MNEISSWLTGVYLVGGGRLLWSSLTVLLSDALSDGRGFNCLCDLRLLYLCVPDFKHQLQKILFVEKNDWLKNRPSFITENFLKILKRQCMAPTRRSHDFLSLILAIVGSTSRSCYFLLQCRCLSVCVLCVLVVRCVKRFHIFCYNNPKIFIIKGRF